MLHNDGRTVNGQQLVVSWSVGVQPATRRRSVSSTSTATEITADEQTVRIFRCKNDGYS